MAVAILIGWLMPSDIAGTQAEIAAPQTPPAPAPAKIKFTPQTQSAAAGARPETVQIEQPDGNAVMLTRAADGHFYTSANIRGVQVNFLVDTGASMVALTADDARSLGLDWSPDELRVIGRGANGDIQGKPIMLENMSIGRFHAQNLRAVIIPEGLDVSLLGQSFLSKIGNVNIKADQMTFS